MRKGRWDFHLVLHVKKLAGGKLEVEWKLTGVGPGAPEDIHQATQDTSNHGADGAAGLCGKNG